MWTLAASPPVGTLQKTHISQRVSIVSILLKSLIWPIPCDNFILPPYLNIGRATRDIVCLFLILSSRYVKIAIVWMVALIVTGCYYVVYVLVNHVFALMTLVNIFSIQAMDHNLRTALFAHMPVFGCSDRNLYEHHCRCVIKFYAKHMLWIRLTPDSSYPWWSVDEFICKLL